MLWPWPSRGRGSPASPGCRPVPWGRLSAELACLLAMFSVEGGGRAVSAPRGLAEGPERVGARGRDLALTPTGLGILFSREASKFRHNSKS